jgi:hypothetical protein
LHGLVAFFLEVIVLEIILLLVGLFVFVVLVFTMRVIVALIILMRIVRSLVIVIMLGALKVVAMLATMLPVSQITAACNGKMSHFFLFWLFCLLGLLKDAGPIIGSLALLKKGDKTKRVCGHHLVCFRKLMLMCIGL